MARNTPCWQIFEVEKLNITKFNNFENVDGDTRIARYFKLKRLKDFVVNKQFHLSNATQFSDNHERSIPHQFFSYYNDRAKEIHEKIEAGNNRAVQTYISCWTKFTEENYAMWKIYVPGNEGICAATTVKKLRESISQPDNLIVAKVEYVKQDDDRHRENIASVELDCFPYSHTLKEKYKIYPYKYESEIRFILLSGSSQPNGIDLYLKNPTDVFDRLYIDPFAIDSTSEEIKQFCVENGMGKIITDSIISES